MDVGLLILRAVVGLTLAAHGSQKLFGAFGGGGLDGTAAYMEHLGFRPGRRHAELAGTVELVAGVLLAVGLFTPLAAAAVIGVMVVAAAVGHAGKGFFLTKGGWEYTFVLGTAAAALAFTGAGAISFDNLLDLDLGGLGWGVTAMAVGFAGAAVQASLRRTSVQVVDVGNVVDLDAAEQRPGAFRR